MNILYITHLSGSLSGGPSYSVPAQIQAQSKYDNVFWWNMTDAVLDSWKTVEAFHNKAQYPNKRISGLPSPFNHPDLVVFEDFYYIDDVYYARECINNHIPYIIVPRGAFTYQGQSKKRIKKRIANLLFFNSMVRHAASIHYLTKREQEDSGDKWNNHWFIEPNGIYPVSNTIEKNHHKDVLNGTYIGRFDLFHKGLDLLYEAVVKMQAELRKARITISLYGPEFGGQKEQYIRNVAESNISDILIIKDGVFGEEKKEILQTSDFFIMTSRFEGMPMSMLEAMSFGLPCVATIGTNMSEEIQKHNAGWISNDSVDGIIGALRQMIDSRQDIEQLGENARKLSYNYNWDIIAQRTHKIYKELGEEK